MTIVLNWLSLWLKRLENESIQTRAPAAVLSPSSVQIRITTPTERFISSIRGRVFTHPLTCHYLCNYLNKHLLCVSRRQNLVNATQKGVHWLREYPSAILEETRQEGVRLSNGSSSGQFSKGVPSYEHIEWKEGVG
ncbi:hypothetical protein PoB_002923400 [Plakobranchus ocellatus]|uniref:Uncharacterized protein n=1 Tax=Plakobranchus ocellatus TaxID=259542 RepID=A0AAV4A918_9GAST|nr:hypothetical protein PoB_002923400 [Plakobranchus ocellatus]